VLDTLDHQNKVNNNLIQVKSNLPVESKVFRHKWSNLMHENEKVTSKISSLLKSPNNVKFPTKADALAYELQFWLQKHNKAYASATIGLSLTLSVLAIIAAIYLQWRMRKFLLMISALQLNMKSVGAEIYPPGWTNFPTESTLTLTNSNSQYVGLLVFILSLIFVILLTDRILHYYFKFAEYVALKKREDRWDELQSNLKLFLYKGSNKTQIQICEIPVPLNALDWNKFAKSPNIVLKGTWPKQYLKFDLESLKLQHKQFKFDIRLPNRIFLTLSQMRKLNSIKTEPMSGMLFAADSQRIIPILRCNTGRTTKYPATEIVYRKPMNETTILVHKPQSHDSDLEPDSDLNP
jgi:hypothetical protein